VFNKKKSEEIIFISWFLFQNFRSNWKYLYIAQINCAKLKKKNIAWRDYQSIIWKTLKSVTFLHLFYRSRSRGKGMLPYYIPRYCKVIGIIWKCSLFLQEATLFAQSLWHCQISAQHPSEFPWNSEPPKFPWINHQYTYWSSYR